MSLAVSPDRDILTGIPPPMHGEMESPSHITAGSASIEIHTAIIDERGI